MKRLEVYATWGMALAGALGTILGSVITLLIIHFFPVLQVPGK